MGPAATVVDFGCGSGILTITACKLGAEMVLAVDNDPVCMKVTGANLALNGVTERCQVRLGDNLTDIGGAWDLVLANIGPDTVAAQADNAAGLLKRDGRYILSGFTERSETEIAAALADAGMAVVDQLHEAEWRCWVAAPMSAQNGPAIVAGVDR